MVLKFDMNYVIVKEPNLRDVVELLTFNSGTC